MSSSSQSDYAGAIDFMLEQLNNASLDPVRAESMRSALEDLRPVGAILDEESSEEESVESKVERVHQLQGAAQDVHNLIARIGPAIRNPTYPGRNVQPSPILADIQELKLFLTDVRGMTGGKETVQAGTLFSRLAILQSRLHGARSEAEVKQLEVEELRQAAEDVRRFARRRNILLAQPIWSYRGGVPCANVLFFSGPDSTREALCTFAKLRGFEVRDKNPIGVDFAEGRWHDLQEANLAVFDLSEEAPQVYYEMGVAITLGKELVLLCRRGVSPRFDVGQNYAEYEVEDDRYGVVQAALDSCLYRLQNRGDRSTSTAKDTYSYAKWLARQQPHNAILAAFCQSNEAGDDPLEIDSALRVLNQLLTRQHEIILPRWPGCYPDPEAKRCFVVMPFAAHMGTARAAIEIGISSAGGHAIRGDVAEGSHILRSIWDEINRANLVVVDLTEFNLNVCLELGIAHTLGRQVLLTGYEGTQNSLSRALPNVAKVRLQSYSSHLSLERTCFDTVDKIDGRRPVLRGSPAVSSSIDAIR
ncbi:uncharacterized protein DSM5745_10165 [Aspergillus mulundensis]|uniref:Uncharacterized protein n=1 Tax=Aspergillus mulundensis TaxID=1810919 RepID=A0A3D8QNL8_9EURO|nr:Uncharacterized protein DSM5745_10165 [Aspergillus mulundensis]RDW63054.1 Uncharacterized protein DSM5745_10165 [Aspergillus mulundensis]